MTDDIPKEKDKPAIRIIPPKLAGLTLLAGIIVNFVVPLHPFEFWTSFFFGMFIAAFGALLVTWAIKTFAIKGTNLRIDRPATCIVESGPFSFSRNPIYLGGAILYAGLALMFNSGWSLLLLAPLIYVIRTKVITPEEEYLEKKFGTVYLDYKAKVRRWI